MTFQNTGSAPASNVVITNTIPADVYYSQAIDQGTGPRFFAALTGTDAERAALPAEATPSPFDR